MHEVNEINRVTAGSHNNYLIDKQPALSTDIQAENEIITARISKLGEPTLDNIVSASRITNRNTLDVENDDTHLKYVEEPECVPEVKDNVKI